MPSPAVGRIVIRLLQSAGMGGLGLLLGGTLLASTARFLWIGELLANTRFLLGVGGMLTTALLCIAWRPRLAVLSLALGTLHLVPVWSLSLDAQPVPDCGGPALRVAALNLWMGNADVHAVREFVDAFEPDVLAFSEVANAWPATFAEWSDVYPHRAVAPAWPYGIALLSRFPLRDVRIVDAPNQGPPWDPDRTRPDCITATIEVQGVELQLIAVHPQRPGLAWRNRARGFLLSLIHI